MKGSKFDIAFEFLSEETADDTGFDKIEFMFTANSGQPLRPLNKVASGGEMSRFMLAVKNITADIDNVDTMIFDEIDTGISGDTANVLAKKLAKIGKKHQVVCVTHLVLEMFRAVFSALCLMIKLPNPRRNTSFPLIIEVLMVSIIPSTTVNTTCFSKPVFAAISLTISAFVIVLYLIIYKIQKRIAKVMLLKERNS